MKCDGSHVNGNRCKLILGFPVINITESQKCLQCTVKGKRFFFNDSFPFRSSMYRTPMKTKILFSRKTITVTLRCYCRESLGLQHSLKYLSFISFILDIVIK